MPIENPLQYIWAEDKYQMEDRIRELEAELNRCREAWKNVSEDREYQEKRADEYELERDRLRSNNAELALQNAKLLTDVDILLSERDRYHAALEKYADKKNWRRAENHLKLFIADTNGPFIAFEALRGK